MNKYKSKLPRDDLKRFAKEVISILFLAAGTVTDSCGVLRLQTSLSILISRRVVLETRQRSTKSTKRRSRSIARNSSTKLRTSIANLKRKRRLESGRQMSRRLTVPPSLRLPPLSSISTRLRTSSGKGRVTTKMSRCQTKKMRRHPLLLLRVERMETVSSARGRKMTAKKTSKLRATHPNPQPNG